MSSQDCRVALALLLVIVALGSPNVARANGGTELLTTDIGGYRAVVTASPYPLQIGTNDVSVLVERSVDDRIELDANVEITAAPVNGSGDTQTFAATHANATNKLYYAANVVFPSAGRWQLTVAVDGPDGTGQASVEVTVYEPASGSPSPTMYVAAGVLALAVLAAVGSMLWRWRKMEIVSKGEK